ncbi:hypothetical protein MASR1M32_34050 [Rhodobacter sp.]
MTGLAGNDPARVRAFVDLCQDHDSRDLVANLSTRVERMEIAGLSFPLTVNDGAPTCYICHPTAGYIDYALEEMRNFASHPLVRAPLSVLIRAARPLVRASGLDRQVQVNNWLFSTNPAPALDPPAALALRDTLLARFPGRAILLRSLNPMADAATMKALRLAGFRMLPARQVYLFTDPARARVTGDMRRDRALLAGTTLRRVGNEGFTAADYTTCAKLYADLYLRKYSALNPAYTPAFLQGMHRAGLLHLEGLREGRDLVAFTAFFASGRTLTQPLVGYDTSRPVKEGLYRMMMQIGRDHAAQRGLFFNCSAGAAGFKRLRGGVPVIEYTAAYVGHLPLPRRLATRAMEALLRGIGVPLMERFEL